MAKYKIKIEVHDTSGEVLSVKFQGPKQKDYVNLPDRSEWNGSAPSGGYALDNVFQDYCQPIKIYSKNPSCVVVGGWLFCP